MANVGVQDLIKGSKKDIEMVRSDAVEKVEVINPSGGIWIPIPHDVLPSSGNGYDGQLEGRPLNATEIKSLLEKYESLCKRSLCLLVRKY